MAKPTDLKFVMHLNEDQALALAQLVKRFTYDDAQRLSNGFLRYADGRFERDVMLDAVCVVQRTLAEVGFEPR